MRNLKRVLSLALAAVMLMGMMIVGTSAADVGSFTDADKITNVEAASITTAIGVFSGYGDGSFGADKYVNRAEMATIICKILSGSNVNANIFKGLGKFQDLAGYEWAEGYINMCYSRGIINGTSATTYDPGRPVKTWEAAIMLQRALGWWAPEANEAISEVTVTSRSNGMGLYGDLVLSADAYLTRNDVAELVFNAITKNVPVEYNGIFGTYRNANVTGANTLFGGVVYNYAETLAYQTFGLVYTQNQKDAFGRPAITWGYGRLANGDVDPLTGDIYSTYNGMTRKLVTVVDNPVVEYTTTVTGRTLYDDLGLNTATWMDVVVDGRAYNGAKSNTNITAIQVSRGNALDNGNDGIYVDLNNDSTKDTYVTGNGVLTQVFENPDYIASAAMTKANAPYIIVVVNTYIMKVNSVAAAKGNTPAYVTVGALTWNTALRTPGGVYPYASSGFDAKYETESLAKDDVVLITVALDDPESAISASNQYKIQTAELAEAADGTLTRYSITNGTATVDGVVYYFDKNTNQYAHDYVGNAGGALKDEVTLYLDKYGYAMDVQEIRKEAAPTNYALVLEIDSMKKEWFKTSQAGVMMLIPDGSEHGTIVTGQFDWSGSGRLSYDNLKASPTATSTDGILYTNVNRLVTYTVDRDGNYILRNPGTASMTGLKTTTNKSQVGDNSRPKIGFFNSASILIVDKGKEKFDIYYGVNGLPDANESAGAGHYVRNSRVTDLLDIVYTTAELGGSTSTDLIYIVDVDSNRTWVSDQDEGNYVIVTAVENGEVVDLWVQGKLVGGKVVVTDVNGLDTKIYNGSVLTNYEKKDGILTNAALASSPTHYSTGSGFIGANKQVVGVGVENDGEKYFTWTDETKVIKVDDNNRASTPDITNIGTDVAVKVVYYAKNTGAFDGELEWIFVVEGHDYGIANSEAVEYTTGSTTIPGNVGGRVTVKSGATVTVGGSVAKDAEIVVEAGGTLNVTGNVLGTVKAEGTGIVAITGNVSGTVKASAGSSGNITVTGAVTGTVDAEARTSSSGTVSVGSVAAGGNLVVRNNVYPVTIGDIDRGANVTVVRYDSGNAKVTVTGDMNEAITAKSNNGTTLRGGVLLATYPGIWTANENLIDSQQDKINSMWQKEWSMYGLGVSAADGETVIKTTFTDENGNLVYWEKGAPDGKLVMFPLEAIGYRGTIMGGTSSWKYPYGGTQETPGTLGTDFGFGTGYGWTAAADSSTTGVPCFVNGHYYNYTVASVAGDTETVLFSGGFTYVQK